MHKSIKIRAADALDQQHLLSCGDAIERTHEAVGGILEEAPLAVADPRLCPQRAVGLHLGQTAVAAHSRRRKGECDRRVTLIKRASLSRWYENFLD